AFDITFQDADGVLQTAWTTSWGTSTRMMGGLIMCHGDDRGLRVPPRVAPIQVVVLAIRDTDDVIDQARRLVEELTDAGVRVRFDDRTDLSFGRRATDWELKGVPVRIEVGPRDLANGEVTIVRRDRSEKVNVTVDAAVGTAEGLLDTMQDALLEAAEQFRIERSVDVESIDEAREAAATGFARIPWAVRGEEGETALADEAITVRCLQLPDGSVPASEDQPDVLAVVARAY